MITTFMSNSILSVDDYFSSDVTDQSTDINDVSTTFSELKDLTFLSSIDEGAARLPNLENLKFSCNGV